MRLVPHNNQKSPALVAQLSAVRTNARAGFSTVMNYEDCITDEDCYRVYHAEIRRVNRSNKRTFDCPTCGAKGVISAWQKQQGYHCNACTRAAEGTGF
jgi:tRNA(Ile2) C34 agmatinyltransferase TiaS